MWISCGLLLSLFCYYRNTNQKNKKWQQVRRRTEKYAGDDSFWSLSASQQINKRIQNLIRLTFTEDLLGIVNTAGFLLLLLILIITLCSFTCLSVTFRNVLWIRCWWDIYISVEYLTDLLFISVIVSSIV